MQTRNVYTRARGVVRKMAPVVAEIRKQDRALADQLRRAAQSVVLNIEGHKKSPKKQDGWPMENFHHESAHKTREICTGRSV